MPVYRNNSDKLYTWSDYERSNQYLPAAKTQASASAITRLRYCLTQRLTYRNLQTLRQTGLQMYDRPGTWSQILSVCQLSRSQARDDLHTHGAKGQSAVLPEQPSQHKRAPGEYLRNQSRADFSAGHVLNASSRTTGHHRRCQRVRGPGCEYGVGFSLITANQGVLL